MTVPASTLGCQTELRYKKKTRRGAGRNPPEEGGPVHWETGSGSLELASNVSGYEFEYNWQAYFFRWPQPTKLRPDRIVAVQAQVSRRAT